MITSREIFRYIKGLEEEIIRLRASAELRWRSITRAIKRWREYSGRSLEMPENGELICWLLHQLDKADPQVNKLYLIDVTEIYPDTQARIIEVKEDQIKFIVEPNGGTMTVSRPQWVKMVSDRYERTLGHESAFDLSDNREETTSEPNVRETAIEKTEKKS